LLHDQLKKPLHWKKPRRIFVNSLSDLFHDSVPDEFIAAVFGVMAACPQHTFQVLTKRPERMRKWFEWFDGWRDHNRFIHPALAEHAAVIAGYNDLLFAATNRVVGRNTWPLRNAWLGVSASTQEDLERVVPPLLKTPAAIIFLSLEPLLGPVELWHWEGFDNALRGPAVRRIGGKCGYVPGEPDEWWEESEPGVDLVIVGGETGPGARPLHPQWARAVRDQCVTAKVPFFFKGFGDFSPVADRQCNDKKFANGLKKWTIACSTDRRSIGKTVWRSYDSDGACYRMDRIGKKAAGRELDGRTWEDMPC
jgi:protein gp37